MKRERGSALIEGLLLTLVLMMPMIWLLTVLADLHRGALAATAGAREAGSAAVRSADRGRAQVLIEDAVARAFRNHGAAGGQARVRWTGSLARGSAVEVEVSYPVSVLQAPFLGKSSAPVVWVRARHIAPVDPYGSDG